MTKNKLKVLFVSSGNKASGISPIVKNQGKSLISDTVDIEHFTITGKGIIGYGISTIRLAQYLRKHKYNVIHAHYSHSGFATSLATLFSKKVIVSLMGSFPRKTIKYYIVRIFSKYLWSATIVKSSRTKKQLNLNGIHVIPNGVNLKQFNKLPAKEVLRDELNYHPEKKYVIFVSDPSRPEKNFSLCEKAIAKLNNPNVILKTIYNTTHTKVIKHMVAADALMLSSISEGSPNVIKEAMAANCPIVTTNVGDVEYIIGDTPGCHLLNTFNPDEAAQKLEKSLIYGKSTGGRERIVSLGLESRSIALKINKIYNAKAI